MTDIIMLVDNKLDVVFTIETLLKKNGYKVISVSSAEECVDILKKLKPNLILIDGIADRGKILEAVKDRKKVRVAYMITGEEDKEEFKLYKNVVGYIVEPRDINVFLSKIKELLK